MPALRLIGSAELSRAGRSHRRRWSSVPARDRSGSAGPDRPHRGTPRRGRTCGLGAPGDRVGGTRVCTPGVPRLACGPLRRSGRCRRTRSKRRCSHSIAPCVFSSRWGVCPPLLTIGMHEETSLGWLGRTLDELGVIRAASSGVNGACGCLPAQVGARTAHAAEHTEVGHER